MQLESKDREAKKLKDLIKKQENAREQRRIMGKTDLTNYNTRQHAVDIKVCIMWILVAVDRMQFHYTILSYYFILYFYFCSPT